MYIQRNRAKSKSGKVYICTLLCEKYREGGKIKTRTIANLSNMPQYMILGIENMIKSGKTATVCMDDVYVSSCSDYGFIFVLLELFHQLRIDETLEKVLPPTEATLVKAMIIGKIITGGSKLCIANWLDREEDVCELLGLDKTGLKVDQLYYALGQLYKYHPKIEKKWFRYHKGSQRRIYLYDITSSYFEGTKNELAAFGYNRDGKKGKMQICIGLLTSDDGFPLRIETFKGNTADSTTVAGQILALKKDFNTEQIVFVGDRGMQIMYNLENDAELSEEHIDFITGLTHAQITTLLSRGQIELNLFSSDLAEVTVDDMRYILSVNPELEAKERFWLENSRKRAEVLLENIRKSWQKRCTLNMDNLKRQKENPKKHKKLKTELTVKDMDGYKRRVTLALKGCGMDRYYRTEAIDNGQFSIAFNQEEFDKSLSLCGKYVVCTNVPAKDMSCEEVRGKYKNLQSVEHAFRDLKSDNISIRPIYHRNELQTRGHVLLCMFAYAIIKALEDKLFPFLKEYNQHNKKQLAFNDLKESLKNIKMCELNIGKGVQAIQIPELNELQTKIFDTLKIDPKKMTEQKKQKNRKKKG